MAAVEALERRWGFLAPWCEIFKRDGNLDLSYEKEEYDLDEWSRSRRIINIIPGGSIAAVREALALLAAVETVEYAGWRFLLEKHCGLYLGVEGEMEYEVQIPAKFVLILPSSDTDDDDDPDDDVDVFDSDVVHLCGVRQHEHTTEYEVALAQIAALDERLRPDQAGVDIEIPVSVAYDCLDDVSIQQHINMAKAERIIRAEWKEYRSRNEEVAPGSLRCTFVLKPIPAVFGDLEIMTNVMQVVEFFWVNNVWFPQVMFNFSNDRLDANSLSHRKLFGRLMALIFQSWGPTNVLRDSDFSSLLEKSEFGLAVNKIRAFSLEGAVIKLHSSMDHRYTEAMFSALVQNQSLKKLAFHFQGELPTGEFWWGWMAYALFSNRARALSCTEHLALLWITSMSTADMDAFSRVLASEHPEEDLFGCSRGRVDDRDATLRVGAKIQTLGEQNAVEGANILRLESPVRSVRTFSDDGESEWLNGLIPGLGRCRVRRADLTFDQPVVASSASKLTSLRIGFDRCHPSRPPNSEGLPRFLGMIGASLKYLTLEAGVGGLDKISILESCPQLHELTLAGGCMDAQLQFDEYHAKHHGEPFPVLTYDWYNVAAIATLLADPDSLLTKCVRRLRVYMNVRWNQELRTWEEMDDLHRFEADRNALLTMLSVNRSLEYLEVVGPLNNNEYAKSLRVHHHESICKVLSPLPLACRLAFLSVLSADSPRVQPDPKRARVSPSSRMIRGQLNHDVMANIFLFAAFPDHREVFTRQFDIALDQVTSNASIPW